MGGKTLGVWGEQGQDPLGTPTTICLLPRLPLGWENIFSWALRVLELLGVPLAGGTQPCARGWPLTLRHRRRPSRLPLGLREAPCPLQGAECALLVRQK